MTQTRKSILIVDSYPLIRTGLKNLFENQTNYKVLATLPDCGGEFRRLLKTASLLIIDPGTNNGATYQLLASIKNENPSTDIIVYTENPSVDFCANILGSGARGYLLKMDPISELIRASHNVLTGKLAITRRINPEIKPAETEHDQELQRRFITLTPKEREVFDLVVKGFRSHEIGRQMNVKQNTVNKHRENIRKKLRTGRIYDWVNLIR